MAFKNPESLNPATWLQGTKMKHTTTGLLAFATALLLWGGCTSTPAPKPTASTWPDGSPIATSEVQAADALFKADHYKEAMIACMDIARKDPLTPGLSELEARIQTKMAALRKADFDRKTESSDVDAATDALRHGLLPGTYGLTHSIRGETSPLRTPPTKMQELLHQPVSVHLENVGLSDIVAQIGASQNINIITDGTIGSGTITIHAEKTPLNEILDYIGRNLKVSFHVGENVIWVTKREDTNDSGIPFETRIYHLRKGLSGDEVTPGSTPPGGDIVSGTRSSGSSGFNNNNNNSTPYNNAYYQTPVTTVVVTNYVIVTNHVSAIRQK